MGWRKLTKGTDLLLLNTTALRDNKSDISLWSAFKSGDREAFTILFRQYYPLLVQYGSKITNNASALEDCIQDLFIELWQSRSTTEVSSVKAYLLRSLKYKLYKLFRQQQSVLSTDTAFGTMPFEIGHDNFLVGHEEEKQRVDEVMNAINGLPPRQKEIIYLKIYKGLNYEEISEVMEINYQVARNLFYQSVKTLRQNITRK